MKIGDLLQLTIDDIGSNGEGIAHHEDYTVFVPFALTGEIIKAKITYTKRNLAYGTMVHLIQPSPDRVQPACPLYYKCGGCDIMHLSYEAQLAGKRQSLINILHKNCGYTGEVNPVVPSDQFFYRNKIQLPFGTQKGETVLGFYKPNSHTLVPLTRCLLHGDWADRLIRLVTAFANKNRLSVYDEATQKGLLRHLVARYIEGVITVTLVINGRHLLGADQLVAQLKAEFANVSLYLSSNTKRTNVILGDDLIPVYAPPQTIEIDSIKAAINPLSFFQVNDKIRKLIYDAVVQEAAPSQGAIVIDAYSGVGLLGAILASKGAQIYNIDIVPQAISDANALYKSNGIADRATNICGDAAAVLPRLIAALSAQSTPSDTPNVAVSTAPNTQNSAPIDTPSTIKDNGPIVILDPPRKGCDTAVLDALTLTPASKLIYISCNPATLSRDLATLLPTYSISSITPYDMFPNTRHVETVVMMSRAKS